MNFTEGSKEKTKFPDFSKTCAKVLKKKNYQTFPDIKEFFKK